MNASVLRILVGIDVRRPASWIALAMGAVVGWCVAGAGQQPWAMGIACGVPILAVVAAVGDLPLEVCRVSARHSPARLAAVWAAERAAWPLVGGIAAVAATPWWEPTGAAPALAATLAVLVAFAVVVVARSANATAADAAAAALAIGGCGAEAGLAAVAAGIGSWGTVAAAVSGWCLATLLAGSIWRACDAAAERFPFTSDHAFGRAPGSSPATGWERLHLDPLPAVGPVQATLERLAMATALAAMAGWLILRSDLVPEFGRGADAASSAWPWAALSAGWYVCLAVPRTLLLDGACGTTAWERLFRSTVPQPPHAGRRIRALAAWRLGATRFATLAAVVPAAILGWPPLVGSLVASSSPARGWPPLVIVMGLAAAAAALASLAAAGARVGVGRESLFAATLAVASLAALAAPGLF